MRTSLVSLGAVFLMWATGAAVAADPVAPESPAASFVEKAGQAELVTMELGKLAQQKANCDGINALGVRLQRDHMRVNRELTRIATEKGLTVPARLDAEHQALFDSLASKSGAEFDSAYARAMVVSHVQSLSLYSLAAEGNDPELAYFAKKTLPAFREHKRLSDVYVVATALPSTELVSRRE